MVGLSQQQLVGVRWFESDCYALPFSTFLFVSDLLEIFCFFETETKIIKKTMAPN
jgi:hypothetical protein